MYGKAKIFHQPPIIGKTSARPCKYWLSRMWKSVWCKTQHDATHEDKKLQWEKTATNYLRNLMNLNHGHVAAQTSSYLSNVCWTFHGSFWAQTNISVILHSQRWPIICEIHPLCLSKFISRTVSSTNVITPSHIISCYIRFPPQASSLRCSRTEAAASDFLHCRMSWARERRDFPILASHT